MARTLGFSVDEIKRFVENLVSTVHKQIRQENYSQSYLPVIDSIPHTMFT